MSPLPFRSAPGGLPGLMAQAGPYFQSDQDQPPVGGLVGLIQDYMRNNPDSAPGR
jgi:hypothetical protein